MELNKLYNTHASIKQSFLAIANYKLKEKEKLALLIISGIEEKKNATQTARELSLALTCAQSTAWSILRSLRSLKLISYENKQHTISLSKAALFLLKEKLLVKQLKTGFSLDSGVNNGQ